ncbi:HK97 family phage prohead protease, partial [Bacillus thuringiensis]|nr:HK97 family phage prohead protease [Bacillus thuringiensis]
MAKTKETRTFDITKLSTRDATEEQPSKITGYAAVFNSKTTIGGWFDEVIEPGAFARSLSENSDIRALFNHNWDNVLGRTKSGTLRLEEDEKGLKFEIELPNTSVGRDLAE